MADMNKINIFAGMSDNAIEFKFFDERTDEAAYCEDNPDAWPVWYQVDASDMDELKLWFFLWLRRQLKEIAASPGGLMAVFEDTHAGLLDEFNITGIGPNLLATQEFIVDGGGHAEV